MWQKMLLIIFINKNTMELQEFLKLATTGLLTKAITYFFIAQKLKM